MRFAENNPTMTADTPEARRYNRIHRWLEVSDFVLGLAFLLGLLLTGWNSVLRDWAYQAAFQNYTFSVFLYVFMLMLASLRRLRPRLFSAVDQPVLHLTPAATPIVQNAKWSVGPLTSFHRPAPTSGVSNARTDAFAPDRDGTSLSTGRPAPTNRRR